jgi:thioredoxin-related protein
MTYRCVINNEDDRTEGKIPGFQGYPTTLFLDRTGKVRLTLVGYTPKAKLEAIITTLLAEPAK